MSAADDSFREGGEDKKGSNKKISKQEERDAGGGEGGGDARMLGKCKNVPVSEKAREKQERGQGGETAASLSRQAAANIRHNISRKGQCGGQLQT